MGVLIRWGRGDSNPHALRHQILSLARLPIPALPQRMQHDPKSCCIPPQRTKGLDYTKLKYQPSQLWPAGFCYLSLTEWQYNITTGNADTFPLLKLTAPGVRASSTLPEYVLEVVL